MRSIIDREAVEVLVASVYSGSTSPDDFRRWSSRIIVGNDVEVRDDHGLITHVAYLVDEIEDVGELRDLAYHLGALFATGLAEVRIVNVLPLIRERQDVEDILQKHVNGIVTRTQLISYITNRNWSQDLKAALISMDASDVALFVGKLRSAEYGSALNILGMASMET